MFLSFCSAKKICFSTIFVFTILIFSCSDPKSNLDIYGNVFKKVMLTDTSIFRGFSLGECIDSVLKRELEKPIETDNNYLYYETKIDTTGSFNIRYSFDEDGLVEIESDIFINNNANSDEVFQNFKSYFDNHYGESRNHQGFTVWTTKSKKLGTLRINLSDASNELAVDNAPGKISLWIYPDKE